MARREITGRKPGVSADLIERGSRPPEPDGDGPDDDEADDEPSQQDEPAAEATATRPPIRGPPHRTPKKAAKARCKPATPVGDGDAYGIEEFCRRHRISVQLFYKFEDDMPDTFSVGKRRLISKEAAARWRAKREAATAAEVAKRTAAREGGVETNAEAT
jgi:hypothetical protein